MVSGRLALRVRSPEEEESEERMGGRAEAERARVGRRGEGERRRSPPRDRPVQRRPRAARGSGARWAARPPWSLAACLTRIRLRTRGRGRGREASRGRVGLQFPPCDSRRQRLLPSGPRVLLPLLPTLPSLPHTCGRSHKRAQTADCSESLCSLARKQTLSSAHIPHTLITSGAAHIRRDTHLSATGTQGSARRVPLLLSVSLHTRSTTSRHVPYAL